MGRKPRLRPEHLAEKLLLIRKSLELSQPAMLRRLGFEGLINYRRISEFERGDAEPPLPVLLRYSRVARVHLEDIVDDELELPDKLPGTFRYEGIKRKQRR
jgi:transcriptional regulator with XRE-family HTH domain